MAKDDGQPDNIGPVFVFGSMNWMELAPDPRKMPSIVVVAVEATEMQYDSIETSEIS